MSWAIAPTRADAHRRRGERSNGIAARAEQSKKLTPVLRAVRDEGGISLSAIRGTSLRAVVRACALHDLLRIDPVRPRGVESEHARTQLGRDTRIAMFFLERVRDLERSEGLDLI